MQSAVLGEYCSNRCAQSCLRLFMVAARVHTETTEDYTLDRWGLIQRPQHGLERDHRCPLRRETVSAGRDRGEGNRGETMVVRQHQRVAITGGEQPVLAALAAAPDRANSVDDVARGQPEARRDLRLAGVATGEDLAGSAKPRAGRPMNRAVNAAAAEQSLVCGIDDGVDVKLGDVAFDDLDAVRQALLTRRLAGRSSE
jgi:hypothetical protein